MIAGLRGREWQIDCRCFRRLVTRCQVDTLTIFFVLDLGESIAHSYLHFTDTNTWSWREVMEQVFSGKFASRRLET